MRGRVASVLFSKPPPRVDSRIESYAEVFLSLLGVSFFFQNERNAVLEKLKI